MDVKAQWSVVSAVLLSTALLISGCSASGGGGAAPQDVVEHGGKDITDIANSIAKDRPAGDPGHRTIGVVVVSDTEGALRVLAGIKDAAAELGWTVQSVSSNSEPPKMQAAMTNFINQKTDGIITLALPTAAVSAQIAQAKDAGIPVIQVGGIAERFPGLVGDYSPDPTVMGETIAQKIIHETKPDDTIAMLVVPSLLGQQLMDKPIKQLLEERGNKVIVKEINLANLKADIETNVNAVLASAPDVKAIWGDISADPSIIAPILRQRGLCGQVAVYSYLEISATMNGIREGCVTASVAPPTGVQGYMAIDQFAQYYSKGIAPFSTMTDAEHAWGINLLNGESQVVIDATNVPHDGAQSQAKYDFRTFFSTIWKTQFPNRFLSGGSPETGSAMTKG